MTRKQQQIPGTERTQYPEIDEAADALVEAQLEAKEARAAAALAVDEAHAVLVQRCLDAKVARYKYRDAEGDVCLVKLDVPDPKATVTKTGEREIEVGQAVETAGDEAPLVEEDRTVESRRVRRTADHDKAADPFGSTRKDMA